MIDQLLMTDWITLASAAVMALSAVATVTTLRRNGRQDVRSNAELLARICKDIEYIRLQLSKLEDVPREVVELRTAGEFRQRELDELRKQLTAAG